MVYFNGFIELVDDIKIIQEILNVGPTTLERVDIREFQRNNHQ